MKPVRIAVVGVGMIGAKHIAHIAAEPNCVLTAVVDPDPAARNLAKENNALWFADAGEMLAAARPDGAVVSVPSALHEAVGLHCVRAGVHTLIEKPICHTLEAAERLNVAAEAVGVHLLTGHHRRYNLRVAETKRLIDTGALGRLIAVNCLWCAAKPDSYFRPDWRRGPGAGPVLTNLIHEIDLLRYLVGEITEIVAMTSPAARGFGVEDTASLTLRFANGALGTVLISDTAPSPWTWEQASGESPGFIPERDQNPWRLLGDQAALEFPRLTLWRHSGPPDWITEISPTPHPVPQGDAFALQIAHFAEVIRGNAAPMVSGREGQKTLAATLAVLDAARSGERRFPAAPHEIS